MKNQVENTKKPKNHQQSDEGMSLEIILRVFHYIPNTNQEFGIISAQNFDLQNTF